MTENRFIVFAEVALSVTFVVGVISYFFIPAKLPELLPDENYLAQFNAGAPLIEKPEGEYTVYDYASENISLTKHGDEEPANFIRSESIEGSTINLSLNKLDALARKIDGISTDILHVNGKLYVPSGETKAMIVIVHGDHFISKPVFAGYSYLAEPLAKAGYAVALIDESIFNDRWSGKYIAGEFEGRALMILYHLKQFQKWDEDKNHLLYNKLGLHDIVLIGHSRGGRAASLANLFNSQKEYRPDHAKTVGFNFPIKSIAQIVPYEEFLYQGIHESEIKDVDYLLLLAGMDKDVYFASGLNTYHNVEFSDSTSHFKAMAFIRQANHSGFNSLCTKDLLFPFDLFTANAADLAPEIQRDICRKYILDFVDASIMQSEDAAKRLADYREYGSNLPRGYYISAFSKSSDSFLATYEEDHDEATGSSNTKITASGDIEHHVGPALFKSEQPKYQKNNVVYINNSSKGGNYVLELDDETDSNGGFNNLIFDLYNLTDSEATPDFDISIEFKDGHNYKQPLSGLFVISPRPDVQLNRFPKFRALALSSDFDMIPQTVKVPLPDDSSEISRISFIFHPNTNLKIALDNIGFSH